MATETDAATGTAFGRVNRTVGTVFRYLLLAATLVGIVALAVLLLYVANDAFQPLTADPGWHLTYFLTLVVPAAAIGLFLSRYAPAAGRFGLSVVVGSFVVTLFASGTAILFIDVVPGVAWFAYLLALSITAAAVVALERVDRRVSFPVRLGTVLVVGAVSLAVVPGLVQLLPVLPADWIIYALTLGGPTATVVWWHVRSRLGTARAALAAAAVVLIGAFALGAAGLATGFGGVPAVVLWVGAVVPLTGYAGTVAVNRPEQRVGLALPAVILAGVLVGSVAVDVFGFAGPQTWLDWQFLTSDHSNTASEAGVYPALVGTIMLMIIVTVLSFPVGVGAAIYLEEYAPDTWFTRIIDVNISNLAGVPSIVYGLLGLGAFVRFGGLSPGTVIVGGMTLSLLILPIVIISAREAIQSVPDSMRQASYGMGATRWQTIRDVILPEAFPGILTGTILALGRAIGETAPLLMIGAPAVFDLPNALNDRVGALPLQIYAWASTFASEAFYTTALAAGVVTLLVVMLTMNSIAIVLRNKYERES